MISPQLYWVLTGNDFTLDINNPEEPKILCMGNNPDRQSIYGAALGLYNSRLIRLINKKGKLKSSLIIDELPTIYIRGLDNLIATARSNKVSVCLGFQDFSQLHDLAETLRQGAGRVAHDLSREDIAHSISDDLGLFLPVVALQLRKVLKSHRRPLHGRYLGCLRKRLRHAFEPQ